MTINQEINLVMKIFKRGVRSFGCCRFNLIKHESMQCMEKSFRQDKKGVEKSARKSYLNICAHQII